MTVTASVSSSYRHVRRISRSSGSNFYRSFWLLPKAKRYAMCALYAFARITDDLGDCDQPVSLRTHWLEWWRQTLALNLVDNVGADQVHFAEFQETESDRSDWGFDVREYAVQIVPALNSPS